MIKENPSQFCNNVFVLGIGKGFLTNLLFTSQDAKKMYIFIFIWYY
jgi:hypothetical protein